MTNNTGKTSTSYQDAHLMGRPTADSSVVLADARRIAAITTRTLDTTWIGPEAASDRVTRTQIRHTTRVYGSTQIIQAIVQAHLDAIISDPKHLRSVTWMTPEEFDYTCHLFSEWLKKHRHKRLFWEDDVRQHDPGTRSTYYVRHLVLMALMYKIHPTSEAFMGTLFHIDQSSFHRYMELVNEIFADVLPTARNITRLIRTIYARTEGKKPANGTSPKRVKVVSKKGEKASSSKTKVVPLPKTKVVPPKRVKVVSKKGEKASSSKTKVVPLPKTKVVPPKRVKVVSKKGEKASSSKTKVVPLPKTKVVPPKRVKVVSKKGEKASSSKTKVVPLPKTKVVPPKRVKVVSKKGEKASSRKIKKVLQSIVGSPVDTTTALPAPGVIKRYRSLIESAPKVCTSAISTTITGMPSGGSSNIPTTLVGPTMDPSLPPNTRVVIIIDATHIKVNNIQSLNSIKSLWSGKKHMPTMNTTVAVSPDGTLIWLGKTVAGSTHDIALLRSDFPDFGALTDAMFDPDTPPEMRPILVLDLGYQGLMVYVPGADVFIPIRKDLGTGPEKGILSRADRKYNAEISSIRIIVEQVIGRMKRYGILTRQFGGTPDQLNKEMNIVTGLVNMKHHWNKIMDKEADLISRVTAWRGT